MADYFTQFSCHLDVRTNNNAQQALLVRDRIAAEVAEEDGIELGFDLQTDPALSPGGLWISSDGYGEPEHVIRFVIACAETFDLNGHWGFSWALTCSKPRLDGFGGGAQVIDLDARASIGWTDCDHWLAGMLDPAMDAVTQGLKTRRALLHSCATGRTRGAAWPH